MSLRSLLDAWKAKGWTVNELSPHPNLTPNERQVYERFPNIVLTREHPDQPDDAA